MRRLKLTRPPCLAALLVLCLALPVAARYPTAAGLDVNDYAGLLSRSEAAHLRALAQTLHAESGIDLTVVTVDSYRDYDTGDRSFEQFATGLFNAWEVGDRWRNDGVLVLLGVRDRAVRIELGDGYRGLDDEMRQIIDGQMVPEFRRDRYAEGLVAGVESLAAQLPWLARNGAGRRASRPDTAAPPPVTRPRAEAPRTDPVPPEAEPIPAERPPDRQGLASEPAPAPARSAASADDEMTCGTVFGMIMAFIVVVGWLLGYLIRSTGDAQKGDDHCPMCKTKLKKKWEPVKRPTEHSTGKARFTRTCEECGWSKTKMITLPKERGDGAGDDTTHSHGTDDTPTPDPPPLRPRREPPTPTAGPRRGGRSSGGGATGRW